ncbi:hypothetical protein ACIQU6_09585 [Streptomyces sp. NPDC090442]|uniref:hypothetical protein n=1 Tax=Streptomyces sp. NPDC090442 TaxID=3365962 RepID=UPI0038004CB3
MTANRSAVRHNRRTYYVHVESTTVRDHRLSYRALGVLTYCLDQHDSWCVRSEQLARGDGREGRDAVRKALHELAAHGYYRLERRRYLDGTTAMGAAVSEYPVEQWAQDYRTFGGKLDVPVVEQEDGTFRIRYPDGTLHSDGFGTDTEVTSPSPERAEENVTKPERKKTRRIPPAAARSAAKDKAAGSSCPAPAAEAEPKTAKKQTPADVLATWYYRHATQRLGPYAGKQKSGWYMGLRKLSQQALDAEYTQRQVANALLRTNVHFPSAHQFQRALSDERNNRPTPTQYGTRPAPYSDTATWGTDDTTAPTTGAPQEADDVTFGIVPA